MSAPERIHGGGRGGNGTGTTGLAGFSGTGGEAALALERNGWRLRVTAAGEIVSFTNGAFGDNIGISDMNAERQREIMALFNQRKQERMDLGWINDQPWKVEYQGRNVRLKWTL